MTSLPNNCQTDDHNHKQTDNNDHNTPDKMGMDFSQFPLDNNSMQVMFTGYFNGFGVEVRSLDEMSYLYHMSCFGKGSASRSKPKSVQDTCGLSIMRNRQFLKRNYWYKKFENKEKNEDSFFKDINVLISKIVSDSKKHGKEVIDLVSTDDENTEDDTRSLNTPMDASPASSYDNYDQQTMVVVVPNSDSEDDNYFSKMKPKSCINRVQLQEKLMLTLQEAYFLLYGLGCLQIINLDNSTLNIEDAWQLFSATDDNFLEKYVVFHYFRSKGYIVKSGIKFGGDYLLYKERPEVNHAEYIVVINYEEEKSNWISMLGHVRMANTTVKEVMITEVNKPKKECIKLPEDLNQYSVREIVLSRNLPIIINNDED